MQSGAEGRLLVAVEIELDDLGGLFGCRIKLPFLERVLADLHQQRVTAYNVRGANMAVGSNHGFDLDLSGNVHATSQLRVDRTDPRLDLAFGFIGGALLRKREADCE